jgi:biopolymer transport protein ExbB
VTILTQINYDTARALTFDALFACLFILTFVVLERLFYFTWLNYRERAITHAMRSPGFDAGAYFARATSRDAVTRALADYAARLPGSTRAALEDLSSALYIALDEKVNARLWILDTIVTAAPLLGLLGTILGIMQTFNSLSQGGISDPGTVSRGIGTALLATALGIATALYGLVTHNMLHRYAEHLTSNFKDFLLRL